MSQLLDQLKGKIKKTLEDIQGGAQRVPRQVQNIGRDVSAFVQSNPTPSGYIAKKIPQSIRQPIEQNLGRLRNIDIASTAAGGAMKDYLDTQNLPMYSPKRIVAQNFPIVGAVKNVVREKPTFASEQVQRAVPGNAGTLAGLGVELVLPGVGGEVKAAKGVKGIVKNIVKQSPRAFIAGAGEAKSLEQIPQYAGTNLALAGALTAISPVVSKVAPNVKGFDFGRNKYSTWADDEAVKLGEMGDKLRAKRLTTDVLEKIDNEITYLAKSHLPTEAINKITNDYGKNTQGYLKAMVGELEKSLSTFENTKGIRVGFVEKTGKVPTGKIRLKQPEKIKIEGVNSPKGSSRSPLVVDPQAGKTVSGMQTKGKIRIQGSSSQKGIVSPSQQISRGPAMPRGQGQKNIQQSSAPIVPILPEKGRLNIKRLAVDKTGRQALKDINDSLPTSVISNESVIEKARLAKGTGTLTDEKMKALMAQQLKNRQVVVDLSAKFNKAKKEGASEVELGKIMLELAHQSRTAQQGGTFAGRLLQAQNIIADKSASPMQKIFALMDNAGVSEEKYLKDAVKVNWDDSKAVVGFYRKYVPPKLGEVLDEVRYTNMLSSPLTHIVNTASNALQTGVVTPIEKTITGALDFGKSTLTGSQRKYYTSAGIDYAGGYVKALPQAFKKAWNTLSGKEISVRPDFEYIPTSVGGPLKAYTTPLRALEAMDQFFKTLVEGGVASELKKGPQKLTLAQISDKAGKEASYRLFRQSFDPSGELGQGLVLRYFDMLNSAIANVRRIPGGKWVLPFLQTPTNILKQGVEYSPLGVSTMFGAKAPIEQLSKTIVGTGVFLGAYQLAKNGLMSWEAPTNEKERELYYEAGMQPYSVKIGDKWVSYSKLGPLSYPMAMAAAFAHAKKHNPDQSQISNAGRAISGMLRFFGDQSYVRSIGDLVDAVQGGVQIGPTAITSEAANMAGQLVPYKSLLTWLGRITDPTYRKAKTFGEKMVKDIPVLGSQLEPYTNSSGIPSVRDFPFFNAVSPLRVSQEKQPELYNQYMEGKIQKGIEKRQDEMFLEGKGEIVSGNAKIRFIDEGGDLKTIDFNKYLTKPSNEILAKEQTTKMYGAATDLLFNSDVTDEQRQQMYSTLGVTESDVMYDWATRLSDDLQEDYIRDAIEDNSSRESIIDELFEYRQPGKGSRKPLLTDIIVNKLVKENVISESEGNFIKSFDTETGTFKSGKSKLKIGEPVKAKSIQVQSPPNVRLQFAKIESPKLQFVIPEKKLRPGLKLKRLPKTHAVSTSL